MGWHERAQAGRYGKSKRDWPFWACIVGVALLFVVLAMPLMQSMALIHRYHGFMRDVSQSLLYAREHGSLSVEEGGEPCGVGVDQVSDLVGLLADFGMGKPSDSVPDEPGVSISFGDGSSLQLWPVEITEASRARDDGVLIRYTRADGTAFAYDTDKLSYEDVLRILGVSG